jgi:hypothetical protein
MKQDTYNFSAEDFPKVGVQLILEALAMQKAFIDAFLDDLGDEAKADRIALAMTNAIPGIKEDILQQLYASFGKTPEL